jgi:uncharacterized MnhB-related membrane protein
MTEALFLSPHDAFMAGRVLGAIVMVALLADATVCLFAPRLLARSMQQTGFPMDLSRRIGMILLPCVVLYAIPATSVLGAILITGFLGGAICSHFRLGLIASAPQIVSALLGIATWTSLYLRVEVVRGLLPFASQ